MDRKFSNFKYRKLSKRIFLNPPSSGTSPINKERKIIIMILSKMMSMMKMKLKIKAKIDDEPWRNKNVFPKLKNVTFMLYHFR